MKKQKNTSIITILLAIMFFFDFILTETFHFFGNVWKKFANATVSTILCVLAPTSFFLALIINSLIQGLPEPHPARLWIALVILAPLFIVSAIAISKKTKREWHYENWIR